MKILLLTDYFPPEIGSASHLFYELGKELVKKGDEVHLITGFPRYNVNKKELPSKYRKKLIMSENFEGLKVYRIKRIPFTRKINILRGVDQFCTAFLFFIRGLFKGKYDKVLIYSPPLTLGLTGYMLKKIKKADMIFNVQDLFPQSAIDLGAIKNNLLIKILEKIERFIYNKSDYITVHSEGNKEHVVNKLDNKKEKGNKIEVMPNWVNTDEVKPGNKNNFFAKKYNLKNKFVVSFAGVLGYSQDIDIIVKAASKLKNLQDLLFLIVGDGAEKEKIEEDIESLKLKNVKMLPMQPKKVYPYILKSSDVGLVTLKKEVKTPVVPSKLLNIMSAGIPALGAMPLHGDAPKLINNSNCGICVKAEDINGFVNALKKMYDNKELCKKFGRDGREYVKNNYSLEYCSERYRRIFNKIE